MNRDTYISHPYAQNMHQAWSISANNALKHLLTVRKNGLQACFNVQRGHRRRTHSPCGGVSEKSEFACKVRGHTNPTKRAHIRGGSAFVGTASGGGGHQHCVSPKLAYPFSRQCHRLGGHDTAYRLPEGFQKARTRMVRQSGNTQQQQQRRQNGGGNGSNSQRGQIRQVQADSNGSQRGNASAPAPTSNKPRQMIRVQRSEPRDGIIRNELRFVSYAEKRNLGDAPVEAHVVGEAFAALIARFRELNIDLPGLDPNALPSNRDSSEMALLKDKLTSSEAEVDRLRQIISDMRKPDSTTGHEPEWVRIIESQLRAVSDQLNPLHTQAQRFSPQIADLKAHMRHILDEIHENRVAGKLTDDRVRQDIHAKLEQCRHIAADTINTKRR